MGKKKGETQIKGRRQGETLKTHKDLATIPTLLDYNLTKLIEILD